jgi:cell division protein FtsB
MASRRDTLLFFYKRRRGPRPPLIKVDPRTLAYFGVILILIGLAGWLYLSRASEVAAYAREIRELEREKDQLHRRNVALRAEIAELGSLERVLGVGRELGYVLPRARDTERRMQVVYHPVRESIESSGIQDDDSVAPERDTIRAFIQRLATQFTAWIESPLDEGSSP